MKINSKDLVIIPMVWISCSCQSDACVQKQNKLIVHQQLAQESYESTQRNRFSENETPLKKKSLTLKTKKNKSGIR